MPSPARSVRVIAPAKINVALRVGPRRSDGYHPVATLYQAISLADGVTCRPAARLAVEMTGNADGVPAGSDNIAAVAARLVADAGGVEPDVLISIDKRIPVAGGMAGGSADAAAALVGCDELWGLRLGADRLGALAAQLGSDVPFSLLGGCAIGSGRGEKLVPLEVAGPLWWLVLSDQAGLSTPAVYRHFDERTGGAALEPTLDPALVAAIQAGDAAAIGALMVNDLAADALALRPELAMRLERLSGLGLWPIVSGSGPSVVALGPSEAAVRQAAEIVAAEYPADRVHVARGPVPGAHTIGEAEAGAARA